MEVLLARELKAIVDSRMQEYVLTGMNPYELETDLSRSPNVNIQGGSLMVSQAQEI